MRTRPSHFHPAAASLQGVVVAPLPPISVSISVDAELGRIAEVAERILARREQREDDFWGELQDDLQAARVIVDGVNKLYGRLLDDIQKTAGRTDSRRTREAALDEARAFLRNDTLIGMLTELNARLDTASADRKMRGRKNRKVGEALHGVSGALDTYLHHLRAMQDSETQETATGVPRWTLADVRRELEGEQYEAPLYDLCEEAIRNRRNDAIYALDELVGQATQKIRMRKLR
jgi:hypothetical protein